MISANDVKDNQNSSAESSERPPLLGVFGIFSAIFLLTYLPCVLSTYGMLDDYYILFSTLTKGAWCADIVGNMLAQGRPLNLPFITLGFSPLKSIHDLFYLRIAAVLGIALMATLMFRHSLQTGWNKAQAFALSLLVFSQLPFQVLSAWSLVGFLGAIRIPLAYVSYFIAKSASANPFRSFKFAGLYLASLTCLCASMAMHQAAAMFFWIGLAQDLLSPTKGNVTPKQLWTMFSVFALSCGVELSICLWGKDNYAQYLIEDRKDLTFDPINKLTWFFQEPLTSSLNFNNLNANPLIALGTATFIAVGLFFYLKQRNYQLSKGQSLTRTLLLLTLPILCYFPNLIVAESWASYRTLYALTALMVLYLFCAIQAISHQLKVGLKAVTATLFTLAFMNLICANQYVDFFICKPQVAELELLRYRLKSGQSSKVFEHSMQQLEPRNGKGRYDIWKYDDKSITPGWSEGLAPDSYYDEFGRPSASRPFIAKSMIGLLLRESPENSAPANGK